MLAKIGDQSVGPALGRVEVDEDEEVVEEDKSEDLKEAIKALLGKYLKG